MAPELLFAEPMRWRCIWPLLVLAGCDQGEPPFDELPLRDALRADPAVLATLPDAARARLASRFEDAREGDSIVDHFSDDPSEACELRVFNVDRTRQARQAEPLLLGLIRGGAAWSIDGDDAATQATLPPLGGVPATATADVEARALDGQAGAKLRTLMSASGAQHLERVLGWPSGAVAIDDTIYVNASWLVALAPAQARGLDGGALDGGIPDGELTSAIQPARAPTVSTTVAVLPSTLVPPPSLEGITEAVADTAGPRFRADAGAPTPPRTEPSSSTSGPIITDDACITCADGCASAEGQDYGSDDTNYDEGAYVGSDDACGSAPEDPPSEGVDDCASSEDGSGDPCASPSTEVDASGMESSGCQIAPRAAMPRKKGSRPSAWLLAPLGYLFYRRRP